MWHCIRCALGQALIVHTLSVNFSERGGRSLCGTGPKSGSLVEQLKSTAEWRQNSVQYYPLYFYFHTVRAFAVR